MKDINQSFQTLKSGYNNINLKQNRIYITRSSGQKCKHKSNLWYNSLNKFELKYK